MPLGTDNFFEKLVSINFIVKNLSEKRKIHIFNYPIMPGHTRDLLAIPGVSEHDIRRSLIKGELSNFIRKGVISVISSSIDLIQFDLEQKQFLIDAGVPSNTTGNIINNEVSGFGAEGIFNANSNVGLLDLVYLSGANTVDLATSNNPSLEPIVGFVSAVNLNNIVTVRYNGEISGFSGLQTGQKYYLGIAPGTIDVNPPTDNGQVLQKVGFAKNSTTLIIIIDLDPTIL
jgi:hypothetical protein